MKGAGALVLILGFVAAAVLALLPTSVTVFGTDVDCSSPIRRVISSDSSTGDQFQDDIVDQCRSQSVVRLVIGGVVGGGLVVAGIVMISLGGAAEAKRSVRMMPAPMAVPPGWHPDPMTPGAVRWWDGMGWTDQVAHPTQPPTP